jgi:TonB family protein
LTEKKFADKQTVMPTKDVRRSYNAINSKYEEEPIRSAWPADEKSTPVPPLSVRPEDNVAATSEYARMIQQKISSAIIYPSAAFGSELAGTVKLKLRVLKDGSLASEEMTESSGYDILDQDALQAAKTAAPYGAFSAAMGQDDMVFTVPIVYNRATMPAKPAPLSSALTGTTAYERMVQEKISSAITFPPQAKSGEMSGTVRLKLHILKDGTLDSQEVIQSSGNDVLDQDAMQAAKTAAPYGAFTSGMDQQELTFTIPIIYNNIISAGKSPAEKVIASY